MRGLILRAALSLYAHCGVCNVLCGNVPRLALHVPVYPPLLSSSSARTVDWYSRACARAKEEGRLDVQCVDEQVGANLYDVRTSADVRAYLEQHVLQTLEEDKSCSRVVVPIGYIGSLSGTEASWGGHCALLFFDTKAQVACLCDDLARTPTALASTRFIRSFVEDAVTAAMPSFTWQDTPHNAQHPVHGDIVEGDATFIDVLAAFEPKVASDDTTYALHKAAPRSLHHSGGAILACLSLPDDTTTASVTESPHPRADPMRRHVLCKPALSTEDPRLDEFG